MTKSTITREIPAEWTPQALAAFIADLIRNDPQWWDQKTWWGGAFAKTETRSQFREDGDRLTVETIAARLARNEWSCGSTCCVAGWAAVLTSPAGSVVDPLFDEIIGPDGNLGFVEDIGREALDLEGYQASYLFYGGRTRDEVLAALDAIATGSWMLNPA